MGTCGLIFLQYNQISVIEHIGAKLILYSFVDLQDDIEVVEKATDHHDNCHGNLADGILSHTGKWKLLKRSDETIWMK